MIGNYIGTTPAGNAVFPYTQNLRGVKPYPKHQDIVHAFKDPIKADSHLVVLYGNLAPEGGVAKITGKEGLLFKGSARVFDSTDVRDFSWKRQAS